jgi:hypothetical protein
LYLALQSNDKDAAFRSDDLLARIWVGENVTCCRD